MPLKRSLFALCIFCCIQINAFSQSIYSVDSKKDLIIGTLSLGIGTSLFFINNKPENIPGILNRNEVNIFALSLMFFHNNPLDIISDYAS
jgi:hypothetical protein